MARNKQLVKRRESFFMEYPCGYSSICGSVKERELKHKLHRKRCESCRNRPVDTAYYRYTSEETPLNATIDKRRMYTN